MNAHEIVTHAEQGSDWLRDQQTQDGGWRQLGDPYIDAFYKGAWAFATTGRLGAAHRLLTHVRDTFLEPHGDLEPRGLPMFRDIHPLYPNAYVVTGSVLCSRYDVATPTTRYLVARQHPGTGGFYSQRDASGDTSRTDTMSTSAAGVACLAAGELNAARRAGDYLEALVERQPAPDDGFYYTVSPGDDLRTSFDDEGEAWWGVVRTDEPDQCWYAVGLPFAFLIQLAEATGSNRYREAAEWYFDFQRSCVNPWSGPSSGKAAWGTAMLYRITGEERYRQIAVDIAESVMIEGQNDDGSWVSDQDAGYAGSGTPELENVDFDITAEYTLWLALIGANLLARDADRPDPQ